VQQEAEPLPQRQVQIEIQPVAAEIPNEQKPAREDSETNISRGSAR